MVSLDPVALGKESRKLADQLAEFHKQLASLEIPQTVYMGIHINDDYSFEVAELGGQKFRFHEVPAKGKGNEGLIEWLRGHMKQHNVKIMAVGLGGRHKTNGIASRLWLELDIVPHFIAQKTHRGKEDLMQTARIAEALFRSDLSAKAALGEFNLVDSSYLVGRKDYEGTVSSETWQRLVELTKSLKGKKVVFFSATTQGGGVAIMRHALVRLYRLLGAEVSWHVLYENPEVFSITKSKFHNVLQGVAGKEARLTQEDKNLFASWSEENARSFRPVIEGADVIVIDDPQPSGMIKFIEKWNPKAKLLYRSHIQIRADLVDKAGTVQNETWKFIWDKIKNCEVFIAHPIRAFVPKAVPDEKVVLMPPVFDNFDGLNKPLSREQNKFYMKLVNRYLLETQQGVLDESRPYITQVARFDPSKGIPDVIEAYIKLCVKLPKKKRPQLVIAGHGSVDDPDGAPIYTMLRELLREKRYKEFAGDIKLARLPHIDQTLNVIVKNAKVVVQLSHSEGFEFKVSEAQADGKPVVVSRAGGIPLQVEDGETGFVVDVAKTEEVAERLYQLFEDDELYKKMSKAAEKTDYTWVTTVQNAINWLYLAKKALDGELPGDFAHLPTLANPGLWYPVPERM